MNPLNLYVIGFSCLVCLDYWAQGVQQTEVAPPQQDSTLSPPSTIYQIRRHEPSEQKPYQKQPRRREPLEKHRGLGLGLDHGHAMAEVPAKATRGQKIKNGSKNSHSLNKKLLNKLGLSKIRGPNSHNRKRLAVESRRHASPDDSHMFIIKLPPNLYYYTSPKAIPHAGAASAKNALDHHANGKKVSFPFSSNGKPGRIYHWNLPAIKKILEDKTRFPNVATATKDQLIDIKDVPTWTKPWENETIEKSFGKSGMMGLKKSLKRKSPSYYAPTHSVNKNSFNKYFPGNGKPKGFYVIKENQKKPLYYKNIVA